MKKVYKSTISAIGLATFIFAGSVVPANAANYTNNDIKTTSRAEVSKAYKNSIEKGSKYSVKWTGKVKGCKAGTASKSSINASVRAINFYRGLNGLEKVRSNAKHNANAQKAALMMTANNMLSHYTDKSWKCYSSAGAQAAYTSNIYLGGTISNPVDPVWAYMTDFGQGNESVGHRRWLMRPALKEVGIGTAGGGNAIKVIDTAEHSKYANPKYVNFPNAGYTPAQLEPYGRWSVTRKGADFSKAKVKVYDYKAKKYISVKKHRVENGSGDNTMTFTVKNVYKSVEKVFGNSSTRKYRVEVTGIKIGKKVEKHTYKTTFFDAKRSK